MKFGKLLKTTCEGMPEMHDLFLRYKELKKHLKHMKVEQAAMEKQTTTEGPHQAEGVPGKLSPDEQAFIKALNEDLSRFNDFFMSAEEDNVIKLQALLDQIQEAAVASGNQQEQLSRLMAQLVDFHGEMVLLLHWSLLNYAAVVKILKKHDKRTGLLLRAPYLANVLHQPFSSTSIMSRLVKKAEENICSLSALLKSAEESGARQAAAAAAKTTAPPALSPAAAPAAPAPAAATFEGISAAQTTAPTPPEQAGESLPSRPSTSSHHQQHQRQHHQQQQLQLAAGCEALPQMCGTESVFQRTALALETWDTLASTASTPSTLLPSSHSQELMRQLRLRQRWSKLISSGAAGAGASGRGVGAGAAPATSSAAGGGEAWGIGGAGEGSRAGEAGGVDKPQGGEQGQAPAAGAAAAAGGRRRVAMTVEEEDSDVSSVEYAGELKQRQQQEQGSGSDTRSKQQQQQEMTTMNKDDRRGSGQKRTAPEGEGEELPSAKRVET